MFMLFSFDRYYPRGGMNDWRASFTDMEDFKRWTIYTDYEIFQIFDTHNGNKSTLELHKKIQEIEDIEPIEWHKEAELRRELIHAFVKEFVEGE
jgi:hypothetical protein